MHATDDDDWDIDVVGGVKMPETEESRARKAHMQSWFDKANKTMWRDPHGHIILRIVADNIQTIQPKIPDIEQQLATLHLKSEQERINLVCLLWSILGIRPLKYSRF